MKKKDKLSLNKKKAEINKGSRTPEQKEKRRLQQKRRRSQQSPKLFEQEQQARRQSEATARLHNMEIKRKLADTGSEIQRAVIGKTKQKKFWIDATEDGIKAISFPCPVHRLFKGVLLISQCIP